MTSRRHFRVKSAATTLHSMWPRQAGHFGSTSRCGLIFLLCIVSGSSTVAAPAPRAALDVAALATCVQADSVKMRKRSSCSAPAIISSHCKLYHYLSPITPFPKPPHAITPFPKPPHAAQIIFDAKQNFDEVSKAIFYRSGYNPTDSFSSVIEDSGIK